MAQFDVYLSSARNTPYVVDVQSDLLTPLATRLVIPLSPASSVFGNEPITRLTPIIQIGGDDYVLGTPKMAAVMAADLKLPVANLGSTHRDHIIAALDFIIHGY